MPRRWDETFALNVQACGVFMPCGNSRARHAGLRARPDTLR
ncbi:hypothetical protein PAMC26577_30880 [Caballeronia sordidicola]|uniref:Uncharacterized protein n=1 Tax=Caballeronia sordidicola TaxID=196367 RepID=A0A242MDS6_CABSO|nr:hypothetical protein PAMC26577_30880 [Caballeronia sordidicola]